MQFWNTEKKSVACVTHRSIFHFIETTAALIKFEAQYYKRNVNHTEGDSLGTVTSPAHSEERQIRAAAPRTRDGSCRGETKTCTRFPVKLMG